MIIRKECPNYTMCAVIVHGKSELQMVRYITSNLRLPVKIIARNRGKSSIQINGLLGFLKQICLYSLIIASAF